MPNPRSGTVVDAADMAKAVRDARQGRVEFRLDRTAIVHVPIGKVSFDAQALEENMATLVSEIVKAKPSRPEGRLHQVDHADDDDGPRHPPRPDADAGDEGRIA